MEEDYYTKHIITYMGNKRKFVGKIKEIIELVKNEIGEKKPTDDWKRLVNSMIGA